MGKFLTKRTSYFKKVEKEFENKGWDLKKVLGRKKVDTYLKSEKGFEELKANVKETRSYYKERDKIHSEYLEIQERSKARGKEIRQKQYDNIFKKKRPFTPQTDKGVTNKNGIYLTENQVKQLKNIFNSHRKIYRELQNKLVKDYGLNKDDLSLLEGEILQSNKGNSFQLPINIKGFESFKSLIDSFTIAGNVSNLISIYKKDLDDLKNNRLTIKDRIEGTDFKEMFAQLREEKLISEEELKDLEELISRTRFTTKEAIRNHFGKLTNMIESDPITGVKVKNHYQTIKNWIVKFDNAEYMVRS